jgi:hypothetical protein
MMFSKYRYCICNLVGNFFNFLLQNNHGLIPPLVQAPGDVLGSSNRILFFSVSILRAFLNFWVRFRLQQAKSMRMYIYTGTNKSKCVCTNESGLGPSLVCVRTVMFIPDPNPDFLPIPDPGFRIPDPGVKKAPDPQH